MTYGTKISACLQRMHGCVLPCMLTACCRGLWLVRAPTFFRRCIFASHDLLYSFQHSPYSFATSTYNMYALLCRPALPWCLPPYKHDWPFGFGAGRVEKEEEEGDLSGSVSCILLYSATPATAFPTFLHTRQPCLPLYTGNEPHHHLHTHTNISLLSILYLHFFASCSPLPLSPTLPSQASGLGSPLYLRQFGQFISFLQPPVALSLVLYIRRKFLCCIVHFGQTVLCNVYFLFVRREKACLAVPGRGPYSLSMAAWLASSLILHLSMIQFTEGIAMLFLFYFLSLPRTLPLPAPHTLQHTWLCICACDCLYFWDEKGLYYSFTLFLFSALFLHAFLHCTCHGYLHFLQGKGKRRASLSMPAPSLIIPLSIIYSLLFSDLCVYSYSVCILNSRQ